MIAAVTAVALDGIRAAAPSGVEVRPLADGPEAATFVVPAGGDDLEAVAASRTVEVVQTLSAGTDWVEPHLPPQATLCAARGARDIPVAEWVVGALLGALYGQFRAAHLRSWEYGAPRELHALRVLIVGFGSIGRAVQARLEPFGAQVTGVASRARDGVHGAGELPELLTEADAVVVLLPLSDATRGMIGAAELAGMKREVVLVNFARADCVDQDALVEALRERRIAAAILDLTDPEPLAPGHPLWSLDNAHITMHLSGIPTPASQARAAERFVRNCARFRAGEPLEAQVDLARGY